MDKYMDKYNLKKTQFLQSILTTLSNAPPPPAPTHRHHACVDLNDLTIIVYL